MSRHVVGLVGALLLVPLLAGCSGTRLFTWPWQKPEIPTASARNPVHRIICMWEPSEGRGPDGLPSRGFAGQVLFFTRTSTTPVKVEGDVRVYVWDDQGGSVEEQGRAIHQFDFLHSEAGDAWNRHLAIGTLGPSYNVFIPYTRRGRHQARCALQIRYTSPQGELIYSDTASIVLAGPEAGGTRGGATPLTVPQPTRTVTEYVEGPFGRKEVKPLVPRLEPGNESRHTQAARPATTPAIGSIVRTPRGEAITQPAVQQPMGQHPAAQQAAAQHGPPQPSGRSLPAADFSEWDTSAVRGAAGAGMTPAGSTIDPERLARIEQMLAQLAQQSGKAAADAARVSRPVHPVVPAAGEHGSGDPYDSDGDYEVDWPVTPAGFDPQPAPVETRSAPAALHVAEPVGPRGASAWDDAAASMPPHREPSLLSPAMLERTARRLRPRPSWFEEQRWQPDEQPPQQAVTPAAQSHPLAGGMR